MILRMVALVIPHHALSGCCECAEFDIRVATRFHWSWILCLINESEKSGSLQQPVPLQPDGRAGHGNESFVKRNTTNAPRLAGVFTLGDDPYELPTTETTPDLNDSLFDAFDIALSCRCARPRPQN